MKFEYEILDFLMKEFLNPKSLFLAQKSRSILWTKNEKRLVFELVLIILDLILFANLQIVLIMLIFNIDNTEDFKKLLSLEKNI